MGKTELGPTAEDSAVRHIKVCCPLLKVANFFHNLECKHQPLVFASTSKRAEVGNMREGRLPTDTPRH